MLIDNCMMVIVSIDVAKWLITFISSWWWWLIDGKIQIKKLTSQFSYKFIKQVFGWRAKKDFMRIVARSKWSHLTRNIIFCRLASCSTIQVKKTLQNYDNMTIVVWGALRSVDFIPSLPSSTRWTAIFCYQGLSTARCARVHALSVGQSAQWIATHENGVQWQEYDSYGNIWRNIGKSGVLVELIL
jgi:hypothetical protein